MNKAAKGIWVLPFIGLSLHIFVDILSFHSSTVFFGVEAFTQSLYTSLLILSRIVMLAVVASFTSHVVSVNIRRPLIACSCAVVSVSAFICIGVGAPLGGAVFVAVGAVLLGASQGVASLFWLSTLAAFNYRGSYLYLLSGHACATVLCAAVLLLPFAWIIPITTTCVALSNVLLICAPKGIQPEHSLSSRAVDIARHLGKAVATVCLFALASGVMASVATNATASVEPVYAQYSVLVVSVVVLIIMSIPALVFKQPLKIENGYKVALPLAALGFLVLPGLPHLVTSSLVGPLTTTGYMVTGIILSCFVAEAARTARMSPLTLFSATESITLSFLFIGLMIGGIFEQYLDQANVGLALIATGCLYLLALAASWFFSRDRTERSLSRNESDPTRSNWNADEVAIDATAKKGTTSQTKHVLDSSLEAIADMHDFTSQEREVFFQLAEGRTLTRIAQDLYLSTSSVKYHTQKIYRSFDVHSRSELNDAIVCVSHRLSLSQEHTKGETSKSVAHNQEVNKRAELAEELAREYELSKRETEVMSLLAQGETIAEIARELEISENTARTHTKRIYSKLNVHSKQDIIDLCRNREN